MSHYFIADDTLKSNIQTVSYSFSGKDFTFTTDSGIFSPDHVDYASDLLIKNLPALSGSMLDLGCGYGAIGIALAKVYNLTLSMADVNERALRYASQNCERNGINADIIHSDSFKAITGCYDSIVLNPPIHAGKAVIYDMYEQSYHHLNNNGKLYIVIQQKHGANSSIKRLQEIFGYVDILYKKKGFYILSCEKIHVN